MKKTVIIMIFIVICLFGVTKQVYTEGYLENISFMTEEYPPYNFMHGDKLNGISIEIIKEIFKKLRLSKTIEDVRMLPWARGYKLIQLKKNTCLFAMVRTKSRENLFKWAGPIIETENGIIAKKSKNFKISDINDIRGKIIGTNIDDVGEKLLMEAGFLEDELDRISQPVVSVHKLALERIDMWSYDVNVGMWLIKKENYNIDEFEIIHSFKKAELWYAFHKDTPDDVIKEFQDAIDELKKEGKITKIINMFI